MSVVRKRYFINRLTDYLGEPCDIPIDLLKQRCTEILNTVLRRQGTTSNDCDGGLYVGLAGVAYMCQYVAQSQHFADQKSMLLDKAKEYINISLTHAETSHKRDASVDVGFLLGNSGVLATAALINDAMGNMKEAESFSKRYADLAQKCTAIDFLPYGSDELLVGRAGYLCGSLMLNKHFGRQVVPQEKIIELCRATMESGKRYVKEHRLAWPLMYSYYGTEYLGAAHGISGILQMLLSCDDFLVQDPKAEQEIKKAVDHMLALQQPNGNFPCATDEIDPPRPVEEELVHWCHGSPGVVYLMAKAYLRWKDDSYLQACLKCGENVWEKGLLRKGPGICHGVSGNAYVFLLLYRLTNDPKHLHRALQFASFMFSDDFKEARLPDCPYSLYEGLAGTVCFFVDLIQPQKAHFPFFDVF